MAVGRFHPGFLVLAAVFVIVRMMGCGGAQPSNQYKGHALAGSLI